MARLSRDKRRRLNDRNSIIPSQMPSSQRAGKNKYYDPDQDVEERRMVRRGLRDLTRDFNGRHPVPRRSPLPHRLHREVVDRVNQRMKSS